ncbi:hypothetical protein BI347_15220 [Chromobacterium sphagni]|uniref:Diguanylate phosphodiesterase n=1 Tax=Chromobacterium sphagni TaxID=1903179 RepID=A0A1S1X5F6_9NEIS|nr:EAL domain-containing protein [Chromobacterium sphagni]OHX14703.1 hypothetical protein BI347_15220 [Chromobacterium sphagni]
MELKPKRFLILDDQLVLRKLISRQASFFSRYAVEIDEFSDPAEALRSIAEGGYQLIITDIGMPGMNGIDFIKNVARLGYQSALLIISGYDDKTLQTIADMSTNLGIACTRFLSKPYSAEAFVAMLNGIFNELERTELPASMDIELLLADICNDKFMLEFAPIVSLADHLPVGFSLRTLAIGGQRCCIDHLLPLLAGRRMASAVALETMVERIGRRLQGVFHAAGQDECRIHIRIDEACLCADNVFDHCFTQLQQYGVAPNRISFELADGLSRRSDALCFENIAKIKYLGFRLVADAFGTGSLTVGNLLKFPFDQINVPVETLRWLRTLQGEDSNTFRLLRHFGLSQVAVCATRVSDEEGRELALAMGCAKGLGDFLAGAVAEQDLAQAIIDCQGDQAAPGGTTE